MLQYGTDGALAEWLRSGLQNRVHRFNSGRHLHFIIKKRLLRRILLVAETGLEPVRVSPFDFKSNAYTNSATRPRYYYITL